MHAEGLLIALMLDFLLGDPQFRWHPVRLLGLLIERVECVCRAAPVRGKIQGALFFIVTVVIAMAPIAFIKYLCHPYKVASILADGVIVYFSLGGTCLAREVSSVADELDRDDESNGREKIRMLVSRDSDSMTNGQIAAAAIETLAENFSDSAVATLLYYAIGGAPLAWLHRTINTLDAMVGYKNEKYADFGSVAAKMDDVANYLPSRVAAGIVCLLASSAGGDRKLAWEITRKCATQMESPNAGWPMSAFAGALRVSLCGPTSYFGVLKDKPFLGIGPAPEVFDLRRALVLYWNAYALSASLALAMLYAYKAVMVI